MDWKIIKEISIDFIDSKYISVNAKQYDQSGRAIRIVCKNDGDIVQINKNKMYAFVRYRRPDGLGVFKSCPIDDSGRIIVKLSKVMLDVSGKCYADIVLIESETPRSPIAENGFLITEHFYNEESARLETVFSPELVFQYSDGSLSAKYLQVDGEIIYLCSNPAPFVVWNNGTVTVATIDKTGNISIDSKSLSSTMTFCVNVIDSSFYGKCEEIIR